MLHKLGLRPKRSNLGPSIATGLNGAVISLWLALPVDLNSLVAVSPMQACMFQSAAQYCI